ncbi:hypothetical protein AGABI2DRAFT_119136 [Agaricus bisporus var. bisporus H97]|uniref:hypothetical protein n=1 Tax=Agaricus bisporus var. bisporus (strain H97 / ATCC MYA-4626 / FGSC 10389) TaxID=936046 RepID=UPI00029F6C5B|nr:hypothetical protein AGABI2DRAFT_119136 [Agaricus bisporus var. bisporus H97]EKV46962.1 hypothetical protein AGABI2DRAFT_119136 [Agaricus bisporus var. bisporus H97]
MSWILVPEHQMYSLKLFIAAALALAVQASATPPVITCATVLCAGTSPYCCDGPKGPRCVILAEGQTCSNVYDNY